MTADRPFLRWTGAAFAALILLLIVGALVNPNFIGITNLANVATRSAFIAIIAVLLG